MIARLALPVLLVAGLAGPALAQPALAQTSARPPAMLIHGNYCGPGNNAPLAPIDALDAACARHDACTPDDGLPSKACNLRLQREAALISRDPRQPDDLRSLAGLISVGASMMLAEGTGTGRPAATPVGHTTLGHDSGAAGPRGMQGAQGMQGLAETPAAGSDDEDAD